MSNHQPTPEQIEAVTAFARLHGRYWKARLRDAWMTGDYEGFERSDLLQQVRNTAGPSWLIGFVAPTKDTTIDASHRAYVLRPGARPGERIVYVTYREDGYTSTVYDDARFKEEEAERIVAELNAELGVSRSVALSMLAGSMFGWHVPGAQEAIAHFSLLG
jgi:hypothetical protein